MDPLNDILAVDLETASLADLKRVGAWNYSRHPSTFVYCVAFCKSNASVDELWDGYTVPSWLRDYIESGGLLYAHNASFERSIWENVLVPKRGYPCVDARQWRCTQAMGLYYNLPGTLEGLAKALGCPMQKDMEGHALMLRMAEAVEKRGAEWLYPMATPENLKRLNEYCQLDVQVTYACAASMLKALPLSELNTWLADQAINHRGVYLDRAFARCCLKLTDERQAKLDERAFALSDGNLSSASAPPAIKKWLREQGVKLPKLARAGGPPTDTLSPPAVKKILEEADPPLIARLVLENRQEAAKATSLAKLKRVFDVSDERDGRLRWALQFHGAHTGRWTSYGLQIHNLPKVKLSDTELDLARAIVEHGDLETLELMFDQPMHVLSQLLRSVVAAPPGKELIAGDYSAIEARIVAWLAGQDDVLDLFRSGRDVYTHVARSVGSNDRQLGKVCQLALGFGMGAVRFCETAASWGVPLTPIDARRISRLWRDRNDRIQGFWYALGEAAQDAVRKPGEVFEAGMIRCSANKFCLGLRLPSGRSLYYWRPRLVRRTKKVRVVNDKGEIETTDFEGTELEYFTMGPDKSTMVPASAYGGKLAENVTQAVARELLAAALPRFELTPPYEVVMHVHDSLAAEVPADQGDVDEFCELMARTPPWASSLPVAVEGYRDTRFRG